MRVYYTVIALEPPALGAGLGDGAWWCTCFGGHAGGVGLHSQLLSAYLRGAPPCTLGRTQIPVRVYYTVIALEPPAPGAGLGDGAWWCTCFGGRAGGVS